MRSIAISLSPNTEREDVLRALFLLLKPWRYRQIANRKSQIAALEEAFREYFRVPYAWSFNSGRGALYTLLKALGIGKDDEVMLQAFTCNAVPNPVLWAGAQPVYVDIDATTYNIDPADLERKITPRAKAVIVQHTFGIPADLKKIIPIARERNLFLIEDCAHALGAEYRITNYESGITDRAENQSHNSKFEIRDSKLGTFGDAAFFSFGRDKVISSVYGGMLITKNPELAQKIEAEYQKLNYPSHFWVFQQLLHPIVFAMALPLYRIGLGKFLIWFFQKLHLLSKAVTEGERKRVRPSYFPACLPEALAALALGQFQRLERFNDHRQKIAEYYAEHLDHTKYQVPNTRHRGTVWLRFPIQRPRAAEIIALARKNGIYLGDWYREIIAPVGTDLEKMAYRIGSCPVAEEMAEYAINLPTYPRLSLQQVENIVRFLKDVDLE